MNVKIHRRIIEVEDRISVPRFRIDAKVFNIYKDKGVRTDLAKYRSIFFLDTMEGISCIDDL